MQRSREQHQNGTRQRVRLATTLALVALSLTAAPGCQLVQPREVRSLQPTGTIDAAVYRRAETERAGRLEQEVERLRADLRAAEEALVAAESGLRGKHSRADAVSSLAEARIEVERAARRAPWRGGEIAEARVKLDEADRLVNEGHFGAAFFFVYRARRLAQQLQIEADQVHGTAGTRFVQVPRVNLRAGPSTDEDVLGVLTMGTPVFPERAFTPWMLVRTTAGNVGWVHISLLADQ